MSVTRLYWLFAWGVIVLSSVPVPSAFAQRNLPDTAFGAIAYSDESGSQGWSNNHPSKEAAETAALAQCSKKAKDCTVAVTFRNACGALAKGRSGSGPAWGTGWGADPSTADKWALQVCRKYDRRSCVVVRRACTHNAGH